MKGNSMKGKRSKVVLASLLAGVFVFQQSMLLPVVAEGTNITGVTGVNGVYNINPATINGGLGIREYQNFILGKGDTANLNFEGINTFANLVDNKVQINGLINSVRNGNFYNGHAIFVSPKGVIVGPSGVINVGAFSAYAPSQTAYNNLKAGNGNLSTLDTDGYADEGAITIDGKILSRGDVTLYGKGVNIGNNAAVLANVNAGNVLAADTAEIFSKLVNTEGIIGSEQQAFVSDKAGKILIKSTGGINIQGNVKNFANGSASTTTIHNIKNDTDNVGTTIGANAKIVANKGQINIQNERGSLSLAGNVRNQGGDTSIINIPNDPLNGNQSTGTSKLNLTGNVYTNGNTRIQNTGDQGLSIAGNVKSTGNTNVINGFLDNSAPYNTGALNISGEVNSDGNLEVTNYVAGIDGLNVTGNTITQGTSEFTNHGEAGLNVKQSGNIYSKGYTHLYNDGNDGITIQPNANVNTDNNLYIENHSVGGVKVQGHTNSNKSTTIDSYDGNIILGHDDTDNNVIANENINVNAYDANIWNYARDTKGALHVKDGAKTFLVADGDLNLYAENGTIGDNAGGICESGNCTGIGAVGTRDFNKSINANVKGKVKAQTVDKAAKQNDLVINYAAIDSDMNIDNIDADGKVILTVDYGKDGSSRYNINNVATDNSKANIEGWGLSVIASGNIGAADKKVTFNQTKAGTLRTAANDGLTAGDKNANDGYGMDVLANGNVYMKGLDDKYTVNNVCSMVSREGSLDVEFAGNTYIEEVTAKKDVKLVTRGKTMEINHLGTVPTLGDNGQIGENVYDTYLGNGNRIADNSLTGDNDGPGHDNATPNNAIVKALDINKTIRPDGEMVTDNDHGNSGDYYAWADSTAVVRNGMLEVNKEDGNLDITADNVYANGIEAHFKDDFAKKPNNKTNPTIGGNTPTGHAVRPDDVADTGRDVHDRNYYYPAGDGDLPPDGIPENYRPDPNNYNPVDPDNGIVDATPLIMPVIPDTPPSPPSPPQQKDPDNPNVQPPNDDRSYWKKQDENFVQAIDKRQYMRFNVSDNKNPVALEKSNNGIDRLIDVSRGGIAVKHDGSLAVGDVIPVHITYGDLDINADVKVVSATTSRAGAEFVNLDKATANQLLYLSLILEDVNKNIAKY